MEDPLIGQHLAGFQVERLIGHGGMASVYFGWDTRLRRPVAIKVTDTGTQDIAFAKRLVHEARMIARWRHEHVIQVYYADLQGSLYFFAMEYIDGLDLGALVSRYHQTGELIPHPDVIRIGRAVASALDYAHAQGVIHRDVKPSNVLLDLDGRIVLSDFGLALEIQQGTMGEVLGTPHYVAPEQARDSSATVPQSDLYALGVMLYEMLTGSVPFDDASPMSLALKHMTEQPPLPTSINPLLSIPAEAVLLKALSKAPEDRYLSGEVLMDSLERSLSLGRDGPPDERLLTPVAEVLAKIAALRKTQPKRDETRGQPTTAPVRLAQRKVARSRRSQLLMLGGLAVGALAVAAAAAMLFSGLIGKPPMRVTATPPLAQTIETTAAPISGPAALSETPTAPVVEEAPSATPRQDQLQPTDTLPLAVSPTNPQPAGYQMSMIYTEKGFYLINPGDRAIEVGNLSFEGLDQGGASAGFSFVAKRWLEVSGYFPKLEPGKCDAIEIHRTSAFGERPSACSDFNALVTPEQESPELFWLARPSVVQFRVMWQSDEMARCLAGAGTCVVYLPVP